VRGELVVNDVFLVLALPLSEQDVEGAVVEQQPSRPLLFLPKLVVGIRVVEDRQVAPSSLRSM